MGPVKLIVITDGPKDESPKEKPGLRSFLTCPSVNKVNSVTLVIIVNLYFCGKYNDIYIYIY